VRTRKYIQNPGVGDYFNPELFREWHGVRETTQRVCVCAGVGPRNYIQNLDVGDYFNPELLCEWQGGKEVFKYWAHLWNMWPHIVFGYHTHAYILGVRVCV